jgi:hypothetical protein
MVRINHPSPVARDWRGDDAPFVLTLVNNNSPVNQGV